MAILIKDNGEIGRIEYAQDTLEELRRIIGAHYVEHIGIYDGELVGLSMWCDEEGKLQDHTVNYPASLLYRHIMNTNREEFYMAGNVLIIADNDDGTCRDLTEGEAEAVEKLLKRLMAENDGVKIEATGPYCEFIDLGI